MKRKGKPEVYSITGARTSRNEDVNDRTRRYLISMGIRTVCVIGAVVFWGPVGWVLLIGAVFLPYIAVVVANTARSTSLGDGPDSVDPVDHPGLEQGESHPPAA